MRASILIAAALFCGAPLLHAQTSNPFNYKFFYNDGQTDGVMRWTAAASDTLFQMPPVQHMRTVGKVTGWATIMQDWNYQTPEPVDFAIVGFQNDGLTPDNSQAGVLLSFQNPISLPFPAPASGTASATDWAITLNGAPVDCGVRHGSRLIFSNAQTGGSATTPPTDGAGVFGQVGSSIKMPVGVAPDVWAYALNATSQIVTMFQAGTTMWISPSYDTPVIRNFCNSTAYGQAEDLFGPEALFPDTTRSDKVGWEVYGDAYANQVAVLFLGASLLPNPIDISFGRFWMMPPTGVLQFPLPLDQFGVGLSTAIPAPAGLKLYAQAALIEVSTTKIELTDLIEMNTK
jgi:hypothetical protein